MALQQTIYDPATLDDAARQRLSDALYAVHAEIFDGVDPVEFRRYVIDSEAEYNRIAMYCTSDGDPVGYCALHLFDHSVGTHPCTIVRSEVGFLRAWRGQAPAGRFVARQLFARRMARPRHGLYTFACPVHPASYMTVARRAVEYWPRFDAETPPEAAALMLELADRFCLPRADSDDPFVRDVGWTTRCSGPEQAYWRDCGLPEVGYYLARNPGYINGHGLLLLIPMRTGMLARSVGRFFSNQARRRVSRWQAAKDRLTQGRPVTADVCAQRLGATALFEGVPPSACRALATSVRHVRVAAGQWIFRRGEAADALYVIVGGSALVLVNDEPPEVVNQLSAGDVFGELALVTGRPRAASVRAVKSMDVLRITEESLRVLMAEQPTIEPALWRNVARIRYDNFLRPAGEETLASRTARLSTFDAGRDLGEAVAGTHANVIFVYEGAVDVLSEGAPRRLVTPALVDAGSTVRSGHSTARAWSVCPAPDTNPRSP